MNYKILGKTGLRVSELSLGTMTFGEDWGWGSNPEISKDIFDRYIDAGGNFIDTANKYTEGNSEQLLADMIAPMRENIILATKYTLSMDNNNANASGNARKNLVQSVENSLRRLNTEYIDLLWLHAWDYLTDEYQVMQQLEHIVASGKVLHIAISDTPAWLISRLNTIAELRGLTSFCAIQIQYNLVERTPERELIPMANSMGLTVMPWSPLAGGYLSGKYLHNNGEPRRIADNHPLDSNPKNIEIVKELVKLSQESGYTPSQIALAWLFNNPKIKSNIPIIGARNINQLEENLKAMELNLPDYVLDRLETVSAIELGFPHDFLKRERIQELVFGNYFHKLF